MFSDDKELDAFFAHPALADFPRTAFWRVVTDGHEANKGPKNYTPEYYRGMREALLVIMDNMGKKLTPELIEQLHVASFEPVLRKKYHCEETAMDFGLVKLLHYCSAELFTQFSHFEIGIVSHDPSNSSHSLQGIDEFIDDFIQIRKYMLEEKKSSLPLWFMDFKFKHEELEEDTYKAYKDRFMGVYVPNPDLQNTEFPILKKTAITDDNNNADRISIETFKAMFKKFLDIKNEYFTKVHLYIDRGPIKRHLIIRVAQDYLDEFYVTLEKIDDQAESISAEDKQRKILEAMFFLSAKLHRAHSFMDGNGRVNGYLIFFMLMMEHLHTLKITHAPAHITGFSRGELADEGMRDIERFQEYQITSAKCVIESLTQEEISEVALREETKTKINDALSKNPLIALEQVNDLFLRIFRGEIGGLKRETTPTFFSPPAFILEILKTLYFDKVKQLANLPIEEIKQHFLSPQIFIDIIESHGILKDNTYRFSKESSETQIIPAINKQMADIDIKFHASYQAISQSSNGV
jgi:hypothetical protein